MPPRARLVACHLLDPRPAAEAAGRPIWDAVNIPLNELPLRTHELPARHEEIAVVGPADVAEQAAAWLRSAGRTARVRADYRHPDVASDAVVGCLWRPTAFLAEVLPYLRPGAAVDLACGSGRDAVYMASRGWMVTGVDVLPDALERAGDLARRCAAAIEPVEWRCVDLEQGSEQMPGLGQFDLVVGFRYLHRPLFASFARWLKPGGSVVYETFTTLHRECHGRPARDEHVLRPGELPRLLPGFEIRHFSEEWRGTAHTARIWAVRP